MSGERDICQCPTCGRLHQQLSRNPPAAIAGPSLLRPPVVLGKWRHVRFGEPLPTGDDYIMLSAGDYARALHDRDWQSLATRDAIAETSRTADELAFWK